MLTQTFEVFAQEFPQQVQFIGGLYSPSNLVNSTNFNFQSLEPARFNKKYYVLIQFNQLPTEAQKKELESQAVFLHEYIPNNSFTATIHEGFDFSKAKTLGIYSIDVLPKQYKIASNMFESHLTSAPRLKTIYAVSIISSNEKNIATTALSSLGAIVQTNRFILDHTLWVQADKQIINAIADLPFVTFIQEQVIEDKPINFQDIGIHAISSLQSTSLRNLQGKNMVIGVGDNADISSHLDFNGKAIIRHPFPPANHGTHTSGTTAGAGFLNPKNQGMAPAAHIVSQWFSDVILNTPNYVSDYNMIATNNSYYAAFDGCNGNRQYDVLSQYVDQQVRAYEEVLHVIAAGNDGALTCSSYPASFGTVKSGWQSAKNVITVGALDQSNYGIASFSSRGPVADGRIKPEIVAAGYGVLSTYPNNTYALNYGTSMAAPVVTGTVALLQESYRKAHSGANADATLIKAILCNSADDLGNYGPDYTYGFGMLNARKSIETIEQSRYFFGSVSASQQINHTINVPGNVRRLKVLLAWNDYPAAVNAAVSLVNDLDCSVTDPSNQPFLPMVLNPLSVQTPAVQGVDHRNNMEQIIIENPATGNFSVTVQGYLVPQGIQDYVLVYEFEYNGVIVEYPVGGEKLIPGETATLRWSALGSEANTFSIDYTTNNGLTWTNIGTTSGSSRSLNWVVPSIISEQYSIRVSRNGTAFTDRSDTVFTVLGQPQITATVPCSGFVQLNWPSITGAVGYDVMQLKGDSLEIIGSVVTNSLLVEGLDPSKKYWFSVQAKNNFPGRRSVSVSATPNTGTCNLTVFNNNLKAVAIDGPKTGRQFTSTALTNNESVQLRIFNADDQLFTEIVDFGYRINNSPPITVTNNLTINLLSEYVFTFPATTAFSLPGDYSLKAWVKRVGDNFATDDTATIEVRNIANPPITLPVTDGFESATIKEYRSDIIGLDGDDRADFKTAGVRGRARTFVNSGFAFTGNRAITLDQYPYGALASDSLLLTWNLANYTLANQLRLDFHYKNHGQSPAPGNKVWIRGSDAEPWIQAFDLIANQASLGNWAHVAINVNDIFDTLVLPQNIGSSFQVKIGQEGFTSSNVANPILDQDDGYTIDDISIVEAIGDIALTEIVSPASDGCNLQSSQPVSIRVKSYSNAPANNVVVNYRVNNGTVISNVIPLINPGQTVLHTFSIPASLGDYIDYGFDFWISATGDNYTGNDSILQFTLHNSPLINTYPYLEGFENNNGYWFSGGLNSSWEWGQPTASVINKAANGNKIWATKLDGYYNDNEISFLYSPCFDLSGLVQPVLSFSHLFQIETDYDYSWVEYSTDGKLWQKLGVNGNGTNWYDLAVENKWRLSNPNWHVASIDLPAYAGTMRFRFVMSSDGGVREEGIGIDDIHIFDKSLIYAGSNLLGLTQTVTGNNWIDFKSGNTLIASLNAQSQNLGVTTVDVYPFSGAVRNFNNQYYLNRNLVIRSVNNPVSPVLIRYYFTEAESQSLIAASGCGTCIKPTDPYQLGVTHYEGYPNDENGTLTDNLTPWYSFIPENSTAIIPYDNGYYAQFSVNKFSEFWLSKDSLMPNVRSICPGLGITFSATVSGSSYQWQLNNGSGFVNITNGSGYSGATTSSLQLMNPPTSFAGNVYRCMVNGLPDKNYSLRFEAEWNGSVGTDWMVPANWSCNVIPDKYTDVMIPTGMPNQPELQSNTEVRSLSLYPGVQVHVHAGIDLKISGN